MMRVASRLIIPLLFAMLVPAVARADGDPASDVLLGENVFYPYTPPAARSVQKALDAETAAAKRAGFPIKVALIASPVDLGVIPDLFGKPQRYAQFLDQEISFQGRQRLLVVMAAGYGVEGVGGPATLAAHGLALPAGKSSTALAQAAVGAVARLAMASGHPVKGSAIRSQPPATGGGGSSSLPIVAGLPVAAALVGAALLVLRRRRPAGRTN